ncbi:MAG: phosphoribosylamine--glycine ligase [Acidimicrobiales bacterium]
MRACVVGSGGREHALATALGRTVDVVVTPGNPGIPGTTEQGHRISCSEKGPDETDADLVVIGPEAPLVDGLADRLRAQGRVVFGPGADGARLEGSKSFMKEVLSEAGVPTARYGVFTRAEEALEFLKSLPGLFVVKTDGLASGKGVLVTDSIGEAERDVVSKLSGEAFGEAGRRVVIEEGLVGLECSVHVLCDGKKVVALAPARDYKRVSDGDQGPNTGGMGSISPVVDVDSQSLGVIIDSCVEPLVAALRRRGIDYRGVLYAGLMLTSDGPKVLEYNVRFGDPETQVIAGRTQGDFAQLLHDAASGNLGDAPAISDAASVCVVLAAKGYPAGVQTGDPISGTEDALAIPGVSLAFAGAGVGVGNAGELVTSGGRVLGVIGTGDTVAQARELAYAGAGCIKWEGMHYRLDIGADTSDPGL